MTKAKVRGDALLRNQNQRILWIITHKNCGTYSKKQNIKGSTFRIREACNIPIACNELAGFLPSLLREHNVMIIKTSGTVYIKSY